MPKQTKKLYRSRTNRVISGVAGGLGEYFDIDPVIFRILFVLFLLVGGFALILYIILILVIPLESEQGIGKKKTQSGKGAQKSGSKGKEEKSQFTAKRLIGLIVVLFGIVILISNLFSLNWGWFRWGIFWAIIIIIIGSFFLLKD